MKYKLIIEYVGTRYSGWQIQQNSKSVQGFISDAVSSIFDQRIKVNGSGRTDKGVHALGQVADFECDKFIPPDVLRMKINDLLPSDINILNIEKANNNFNSRKDPVNRSYLYLISKRRTAFNKDNVWWIKDNLKFNNMDTSSKLFIGLHNFINFCDIDKEEKSTTVKVNSTELIEKQDLILFRITASHFLWKMVRRIVGTLVEIGRGNMHPDDIPYLLKKEVSNKPKFTAPPSGLYLEKIIYEPKKEILLPLTETKEIGLINLL